MRRLRRIVRFDLREPVWRLGVWRLAVLWFALWRRSMLWRSVLWRSVRRARLWTGVRTLYARLWRRMLWKRPAELCGVPRLLRAWRLPANL